MNRSLARPGAALAALVLLATGCSDRTSEVDANASRAEAAAQRAEAAAGRAEQAAKVTSAAAAPAVVEVEADPPMDDSAQ